MPNCTLARATVPSCMDLSLHRRADEIARNSALSHTLQSESHCVLQSSARCSWDGTETATIRRRACPELPRLYSHVRSTGWRRFEALFSSAESFRQRALD